MCLDASTLWRAGVPKLPGLCDYNDLALVLTQEWALSIRAAKTYTLVLTESGRFLGTLQ